MAKIIGLSGPQGGGKTTLLNGLAGHGIIVDDYKVSRDIQAKLGWADLSQATKDFETMSMFQQMVLNAKRDREEENSHRTDVDVILVERTFADILAYTRLWCGKLTNAGKLGILDGVSYLLRFTNDCRKAQLVYDGNIILPMMPHVKFEADPHRAKEEDVGIFSEYLGDFFTTYHPSEVPTFTVTAKSTEDRIAQAKIWINTL